MMKTINRLTNHYEQHPPQLSYGGSEGKNVTAKIYPSLPHEEMSKPLGVGSVQIWFKEFPATKTSLPIEGYCVVNACLDETGRLNPAALPLWPEMEGHGLRVMIYADMLNCIQMKAIGGFTTYKTRLEMTIS